MIPTSSITDLDRCEFLRKLDGSDLILSIWECQFIVSFMRDGRSVWFTPGRRESADKMRMKYGSEPEISLPFPLAESSPSLASQADAGCCQFLVSEDGRQSPCNAPAAWKRQNGFRYCEDHADAVRRDLKRYGKTIHLVKL